ncbi:Protein of uncharacterised function (DUF3343) [Leminorella richardii]|uniref:Protein of uncharacterized function (DUF3343) n=1 Tax=Leminorella richardii TaxID=158841 RepID=A0A2X4XN33_9GAMM|nr:DUF3343 domain-containing protein [Leminorella richardii]SQI41335.1 Protein of uncharacterised function (DUF3343) [Leminorella richardii]
MQQDYLFLFHTPLGVIRLKKALTERDIVYCVIDAPRALTADCGMAVTFSLAKGLEFSSLVNEQVSAVYQTEGDSVTLKWRDDG